MTIATIIVNYNAGDVLGHCIKGVFESTEPTTVTVIDNASSDGSSLEMQQRYAGSPDIEFLFNARNEGFAPAVNAVARKLNTRWILILNPDCVLEPNALSMLKTALEDDERAGLAGPAVRDENGQVQRATMRRFPDPWKSFLTTTGLWRLGRWLSSFQGVEIDASAKTGDAEVCDAVSGACMLVRRSAFEAAGMMDEAYAMHCEDLDLMHRLKDCGWHCLYVPRATCVHHQGSSSRSRPLWVHFQKHRGMARFFAKFQAASTPFPIRILVYAGIWLRFLVRCPLVLIKR